MDNKSTYILVESTVLPEIYSKVLEVKRILEKGDAKTINEAVKMIGISRSAFYKYKDHVLPFYETSRGKVITLFFVVENLPGILSDILNKIARAKANIITINQNIPINGLANITISVETSGMTLSIGELMSDIGNLKGVRRQEILARE